MGPACGRVARLAALPATLGGRVALQLVVRRSFVAASMALATAVRRNGVHSTLAEAAPARRPRRSLTGGLRPQALARGCAAEQQLGCVIPACCSPKAAARVGACRAAHAGPATCSA